MTSFRHEPLACDIALERLDALSFEWPPEEPLDPELRAAWEHAQTCSACAAQIEQRRETDLRIAATMQAVPIPPGFKERLLDQASTSVSASGEPEGVSPRTGVNVETVANVRGLTPAGSPGPELRRRAWRLTTATALLVLLASGLSLWFGLQPRGVSLQALYDQTPLDPAGLIAVQDASALPPLPANWTRQNGLSTSKPYWFSPHTGTTPVAWISFELQVSKKSKIRGVLLAALQSKVINPPPEWIASLPRVTYTKRGETPVAVAGWSERGVVYICFVPGAATDLERLLQRVAPIAT